MNGRKTSASAGIRKQVEYYDRDARDRASWAFGFSLLSFLGMLYVIVEFALHVGGAK